MIRSTLSRGSTTAITQKQEVLVQEVQVLVQMQVLAAARLRMVVNPIKGAMVCAEWLCRFLVLVTCVSRIARVVTY